ncbi:hypothetical protein K3X41_14355 [Aliiroseovarius crassostreae]|uniref:hypothetical protein n=1 Tax=Aliiroseovarius crassostreae TaxID=154981 RepID=UPI00220BB00C|nr:hypothetical protein [Aliiroseovarius crassostreae]UWQ11022.1 hypothetical protein K3X41_14355 [Aliiroseovarius crassostreae]
MNNKRPLFEGFHERMSSAIEKNSYFEASWYAYAILEDRLLSMLRQSGGVGRNGSSTAIRMLGPKLGELKNRTATDRLLKENFPETKIDAWKDERNNLMHAMAEGTLTQAEIDKKAYLLATQGRDLVKEVSAAAMRLKKHRAKARQT